MVDGTHAPKKLKNSKTVIKGDQKIKCISAASIVAKAYRDLYMIKLGDRFPKYKWHKNFGYGTSQHLKALKKFDVKKLRKLNLAEIGQIAGRAVRYLNNGNFGITGECKEINAHEVDSLENHKFEEIQFLFWRNSNLNFESPLKLLKSLEEKPNRRWLRKIHECEDEKALKFFLRDNIQSILCMKLNKNLYYLQIHIFYQNI